MIKDLKASPDPVDLLLTDIQLPCLTGLELIDKLEKARLSVPILVITGFGSKEMVVELMCKGCAEYIDKPFKPEDLLKRVALIFEKRKMAMEEEEKKTSDLNKKRPCLIGN